MFMHTNDADVNFVSFTDMGRTDKSMPVNDHRFVSDVEGSIGAENTVTEELGGANVRGRYSVHFHRGGTEKDGEPAKVNGAVVEGDVGWAYVNHSSNVEFTNNVSYDVTGAAYNTEAGDELGSFINNIAIRTVNQNANPLHPSLLDESGPFPGVGDFEEGVTEPDDRRDLQDYGFEGDGFWLHGANVDVQGNVVSGATGHAYIYWSLGLAEKGKGEALVDVANIPNGDLIGPPGTLVRTKQVPAKSFDGNVGYGTTKGLQIHYLHTDHRDPDDRALEEDGLLFPVPDAYEAQLSSTFQNSTFWNVALSGVDAPYSEKLIFDNIDVRGVDAVGSYGFRLDHFANDDSLTLQNSSAQGFHFGATTTPEGEALVQNVDLAANNEPLRVQAVDIDDDEDGDEDQDDGDDEDIDDDDEMGDGDDDGDDQDEDGDDEDADEEPDDEGADDEDTDTDDDEGADEEDADTDDDEDGDEDPDDDMDEDGEDGGDQDNDADDDDASSQQGATGIDSSGSSAADRMAGTADNDMMHGRGGGDVLRGLDGDDTLDGGGGRDRLIGNGGNDRLDGGGGRDKLKGGGGDDVLLGGRGRDVLNGGEGADTLDGGGGRDKLKGGGGADVFVFSTGAVDRIVDFDPTLDRIDATAWSVSDSSGLEVTELADNLVMLSDGGDQAVRVRLVGEFEEISADTFQFADAL